MAKSYIKKNDNIVTVGCRFYLGYTKVKRWIMIEFDFYSELPRKYKKMLDKHAMKVTMPSGVTLFSQGDLCKSILFVTKGRVRVYRHHESGQTVTLYYLEPGEQCNVNFTAALTSAPAMGTAETETEVEGYDVPASYIAKMFLKDPIYQQYVLDLNVKRMEHMAGMIEDIRFTKLDERVLNWLKDLDMKTISMTHEEIANHHGTSREVISRLLKKFEKEGLLSLSRKEITMLDQD